MKSVSGCSFSAFSSPGRPGASVLRCSSRWNSTGSLTSPQTAYSSMLRGSSIGTPGLCSPKPFAPWSIARLEHVLQAVAAAGVGGPGVDAAEGDQPVAVRLGLGEDEVGVSG